MIKHPLLKFIFGLMAFFVGNVRLCFTSPEPYSISYITRVANNLGPDPTFTPYVEYKWYKNGQYLTDGSFEDKLLSRHPFSDPGFYELWVVGETTQFIAFSYDVNYPCPTPPTSSDVTCYDNSFEPQINGVDGGEGQWCIAGLTNWMTGPYTFGEEWSRNRTWDFDIYVAIKCDADHDGNAVDNGSNYSVNSTPYKLTLDRRPR